VLESPVRAKRSVLSAQAAQGRTKPETKSRTAKRALRIRDSLLEFV
jgi:hypothetical protein